MTAETGRVSDVIRILLAAPDAPTRAGIRLALEDDGLEICAEPVAATEAWRPRSPSGPACASSTRTCGAGRSSRSTRSTADCRARRSWSSRTPTSRIAVRRDPLLVTARHTIVEVRRNLARLLDERAATAAKAAFTADTAAFGIVELDAVTCEAAADSAELTGARTLDALHLGAARRVGGPALAFVTFDVRQAQGARMLGLTVLPG